MQLLQELLWTRYTVSAHMNAFHERVTPIRWLSKWPCSFAHMYVLDLSVWNILFQQGPPVTRRLGCGLKYLNVCVGSLSFRCCFDLPKLWPSWPFCLSVSVFISALFILCRSQCKPWPCPNILLYCSNQLCLFKTNFVQMCHFIHYSSMETCFPWEYCAQIVMKLLFVCVNCLNYVFPKLKGVWTEKLLVVAFDLATPVCK